MHAALMSRRDFDFAFVKDEASLKRVKLFKQSNK